MTVLMYGSETVMWKEEERSWIKDVQMNSIWGLLGIRRMDEVLNTWIRELYMLMKRLMKLFSGS